MTKCVQMAGLATVIFSLAGCASPGPPRPPSLHLVAIVDDISATRIGPKVLLHWTTPDKTTDALEPTGHLSAIVCRVTAAKCIPVSKLAVHPGQSLTQEILPPPLTQDPATILRYRVEIQNASGRSAGLSNEALTLSGAAPEPIAHLQTRVTPKGVLLQWEKDGGLSTEILITRDRLTPPKPAKTQAGIKVAKEEPANTILRATADAPGTLDPTAKFGDTYTYRATRVRTVTLNGATLQIRSEPSPATTIAVVDTFPPAPPTGLVLVPTESGPDLSWEPNTEPDLAGYFVYRRSPNAPPTKISDLIRVPGFHDPTTPTAETKYSYSITAVDINGNESKHSEEIQ